MRRKLPIITAIIVAFALAIGTGYFLMRSQLHEVRMYRFDPDNPERRNVFKPELLIIEPGDRVKFISMDPGFNTRSIPGMIPEYVYRPEDNAEFWRSEYSQDTTVEFPRPGIYGYKCQLYYMTSGMAGMIVVKGAGWNADMQRIKELRQKGMGKRTFDRIWAKLEASRYEIEH